MLASAWVYILTNGPRHTTLYVGFTVNLPTRIWQHQTKQRPKAFSARYNVTKPVYYEACESIKDAIKRERYIKGKTRKWKEELINKFNPDWRDLSEDIVLSSPRP